MGSGSFRADGKSSAVIVRVVCFERSSRELDGLRVQVSF
jgi:hypothetical protein